MTTSKLRGDHQHLGVPADTLVVKKHIPPAILALDEAKHPGRGAEHIHGPSPAFGLAPNMRPPARSDKDPAQDPAQDPAWQTFTAACGLVEV